MIDKIFEFLSDLFDKEPTEEDLGGSGNSKVFKVLTKNYKQVIWFVTNTPISDFSVWIADANEDRVPWESPSTMAYVANYKLDMPRREPNDSQRASDLAEMMNELREAYRIRLQDENLVSTDGDYRREYDMYRVRAEQIQKNYQVFSTNVEWYRMDGKNIFHVCSTLDYDKVVPTEKSYKWLDCLYNDGNFMFSVYTDDIPNSTKNLIVGDLDVYDEASDFSRSFLLSNSYIIQSNKAIGTKHSGFFLADEWGLGCEDRCKALYDFAYEGMKSKREDSERAKDAVKTAEDNVKDKEDEINRKIGEIAAKREELDTETDPQRRQEILDEIRQLQEEQVDLEDELDSLNQEYDDKKEESEQSTSDYYADYEAIYKKAKDCATTEEDYQHNFKDIEPENYRKDEDSYFFAGLRLDVDYDKKGDALYCVKHEWDEEDQWYAFRWHVNVPYLKIYNLYPPYSPSWPVIRSLTSQKQVSWEYQLGHLTYEEYEQEDAPNYYSQFDIEKKIYEVPDNLRNQFKKFEFWKRSFYGGDSVNHSNNVSQLMPIIGYVERDEESYNDWSAVGQSNVIKYINMYNIGTGRVLQPQFPKPHNRYACYNLWRRRPIWTKWIDECNDVRDEVKSIYGFGGYPGFGFRLLEKEDLSSLRGRVKQ